MSGVERSADSFDTAAERYDAERPGYPAALIADMIALAGVPPGARVLEIGLGTGQLTVDLARRGYRVVGVEAGANLAAVARRKLAGYPVEVQVGRFEEWEEEPDAFDLAVAATSFHWLDAAAAYPKIARALRPGGALALVWNVHVDDPADGGFFGAVQSVYRAAGLGEERPPWPSELHHYEGDIAATGLFGPVAVRHYPWLATYDAAAYLRLLGTYSDHLALPEPRREQLFRGIADLIDTEFGGRITKTYLAVLYVAARR